MFGKSKNKKSEKVRIDTLVADTAYALDDFMSSGQSSAELLAKLQLSRKQVFEAVNFDDEVEVVAPFLISQCYNWLGAAC